MTLPDRCPPKNVDCEKYPSLEYDRRQNTSDVNDSVNKGPFLLDMNESQHALNCSVDENSKSQESKKSSSISNSDDKTDGCLWVGHGAIAS